MTKRLQAASPARRNLWIATGIVAMHVALVWALQNGLHLRTAPMLVPVELLSELLDSPARPPAPPTPKPAPLHTAAPQPLKAVSLPPLGPASPVPPAAEASLIAAVKATPAPEIGPTPLAATRTVATPPSAAPAALQLPSSSADYLHNPKPPYPPLSARLGETGRTVYKVWVGVDGKPQRAELVSSSGFDRLDRAAHETVMGWRYVPGQRGGVAELMAFNVPIRWELPQ
jgi:protein TonB